VFAALRGAIDAGLQTSYNDEMITEERINGSKIAEYAKMLLESNKEKYLRIFSSYLKENFKPENMVDAFSSAKDKISKL
jgi:hypothetical protein